MDYDKLSKETLEQIASGKPLDYDSMSVEDLMVITGETPKVSKLESVLRGAAQGATFNLSDEAAALLESAFTPKTYKQAVEESRAAYKAAKEENPFTYGAGEVGGTIGTSIIPGMALTKVGMLSKIPGATKAAQLLNLGAKEATLMPTVLSATGQSALASSGAAEGGLEERLKGAVEGAKGGMIGGLVGHGISKGLSAAGKGIFKKAFSEADAVADRYKKKNLPSAVAWEFDLSGTPKQIEQKAEIAMRSLQQTRDAMKQTADSLGYFPDVDRALAPAEKKIARILDPRSGDVGARNDVKIAAAKKVRGIIDKIKMVMEPEAAIPPTRAKTIITGQKASPILDTRGLPIMSPKTSILPGTPGATAIPPTTNMQFGDRLSSMYSDIGSKGFDKLSKSKEGSELLKTVARGMKEEIENTVDLAAPGVGKVLSETNEKLGALLTVRGTLNKEVLKDARKLGVTEVDLMALGYDPTVFGLKQAGKFVKTKFAQTKGGKLLHKLGESGAATKAFGRIAPQLIYSDEFEGPINLRRE